MMMKDGTDSTTTEGVSDMPYALPNMQVMLHTVDTGVPVLWWRSVGNSHTAFVMETMIDEVAAAASGSVCAQVAEVSLQGDAIRVHKVTAAFDCGLVVNR
jgi:isoquinoline 1-oxidoreductase beta subunit